MNIIKNLFIMIFFILFIHSAIFPQSQTDNKKDEIVNWKVLEERIKQNKDNTIIRFEAIEKQITQYIWFFGVAIAIITLIFTIMGKKWIRQTAKNYIRKKGEKEVNKLLLELETKGKEKLENIDKIKEEVDILKNKLKDIDITKKLPEESAKDLAEFKDKLSQIKKEEGYSAADWLYNGISEYKNKNYRGAIDSWEKSLELNPKDASTWTFKGLALGELGKHEDEIKYYEEAIRCFEKAIKIDPKDASAWSAKGLALGGLGKHEEAIRCFEDAIKIEPKYVSTYENLCELKIITGDYKSALRIVNDAINVASELEDKAICLYLKCIIEKLDGLDVSESEREFNEILKSEFTITWSSEDIENWLKKAVIPEDKKKFIIEKTEILKKKKS